MFDDGSRLARAAPHRQIWLLAGLTALGVVAVTGIVERGAGRVDAATSLAATRYLPASQALSEIDRLNRETDSGTLALASSAEGRMSGLVRVGSAIEKFPVAWAAYRHASLQLPGEAKVAADFEARRTAYLARVFRFVAASTRASAPVMGSLQQSIEAQAADLDRLRALYLAQLAKQTDLGDHRAWLVRRDALVAAAILACLLSLAFGFVLRWTRAHEREVFNSDIERASELRRTDLETRLQRALEMVKNEEQSYGLIQEAIIEQTSGTYAELLVADSSRARFSKVASTNLDSDDFGCGVTSPSDCPAASRGQTRAFVSSTKLDACPLLRGRASGAACSALCVPVSIAGKTVGVVHAIGPDGELPSSDTTATFELIARKTGEHVGMLRAFARSETQAQTDALTGLLNRRSLEEQIKELMERSQEFVVAYCDLDYFKQLNDVYGHDAGDRALRLFSRVLRDSVRPKDLPARYGGEEFVMVLPACEIPEATAVIDRIQATLAHALEGGTVPPFTASFGLSKSNPSETFAQTLENADAALRAAKAAGRNRWVIAGDEPTPIVDADTGQPQLAS